MTTSPKIFLVSKLDNHPYNIIFKYFDKLSYFIEIPSYRFYSKEEYFNCFIYKNKSLLENIKIKRINFIGIFHFYLCNFFFIYNSIKKINLNKKVKIYSDNKISIINLILLNLFNQKFEIVYIDNDIIPTNNKINYFRSKNLIGNGVNTFLRKIDFYLKKILLSSKIVKASDSYAVIEFNKKKFGNNLDYIKYDYPLDYEKISQIYQKKAFSNIFVYFGSLAEENGFDEVILISKLLLKDNFDHEIYVFGGNQNDVSHYKKICELESFNHIKFFGFVKRLEDYDEIISKASIGFATYSLKNGRSKVYNGKIIDYWNNLIIPISTSYTLQEDEILSKKLGLIYQDKSEVLSFIKSLNDPEYYSTITTNIKNFAYDRRIESSLYNVLNI